LAFLILSRALRDIRSMTVGVADPVGQAKLPHGLLIKRDGQAE
jgi:hypothetical protein